MTQGIVTTSALQGVAQLPASSSVKVPEVKPGETLFSCPIAGMRVVTEKGESRFTVGGYIVAKDEAEKKFFKTIPTLTEVVKK